MPKLLLFAAVVEEQKDERVNPRRVAIQGLANLLSQFTVANDDVVEGLHSETIPDGAEDVRLTVTYRKPTIKSKKR